MSNEAMKAQIAVAQGALEVLGMMLDLAQPVQPEKSVCEHPEDSREEMTSFDGGKRFLCKACMTIQTARGGQE